MPILIKEKKLFKAKAFSDYLTKLSQENLKPTTTSKKKWRTSKVRNFKPYYTLFVIGAVDLITKFLETAKEFTIPEQKGLLKENKIVLTKFSRQITVEIVCRDIENQKFTQIVHDPDANPIFMFLFDITNKPSFKYLWVNIKNIIPPQSKSIFMMVGDNYHLEGQRQVFPAKAIAKLEQFTIPYAEISSQTKYNVQKFLDYVVDCFITSVSEEGQS